MKDDNSENIISEINLTKSENTDKNSSYLSFTGKDEEIQSNELNFIDEKDKESDIISNKIITKDSKINFWTGIILIILSLIFIPFYSIAQHNLKKSEDKKLIKSLEDFVSYDTLNSSSLKNLLYFFSLFLNKDFLAGYQCVLYIIFHPFVAMKMAYGINISYCILILMQILYQAKRPLWESNSHQFDSENSMILCASSYSNPSIPLFTFIFCIIYSIYSYKHFYTRPGSHMNVILKIVIFIIFVSFLITEMILLIIYRLHYLHELLFTICLAFIVINILIEFENKLQNIIFNATKNFFKLRKNKIKIFLYVFFELIIGILTFNLVGNKFSTYHIEDNIMVNESCSGMASEEISLSNSFMDFSYIFCLLGEFWGASLTLENMSEEWWYHTEKYFYSKTINREINERNRLDTSLIFLLIVKGVLTILVFLGIWKIFDFIPYINFVFNFIMNSLKYFILFFVCTGILPILFQFMKLNRKKNNISSQRLDEILDDNNSDTLFKSSLFVKYFDKSRIPMLTGNRIHYIRLLSEDMDEKENNYKSI